MHWTYDELLQQPQWFINELWAFMRVKREYENKQTK